MRNTASGNVMLFHPDCSASRLPSERRICKLRTFRFRKDDLNDASTCCTIFLSDFEVDEIASQLPCGHLYHATCAAGWLSRSSSCPMRCPDLIYVAPTAAVPAWIDRGSTSSPPGSS